MKKFALLFLVLFVPLFHQWVVVASPDNTFLSPSISPIASASSMAAFSPEQQHLKSPKMVTSHHKFNIALIAASASLFTIVLCSLCFWVYYRKNSQSHKSGKNNLKPKDVEKGRIVLSPFFTHLSFLKKSTRRMPCKDGLVSFIEYKTIEKGTNSFKESNILGQGGFGCVYKTRFDNNTLAAVKKLDCSSQDAGREFQNEVDILSKIQQPNIISLLGYSSYGESRFIVYELMENNSLETHLHGPSRGSALTWHMRMKIALDIARGLEYLHEHCHPQVIHRDLKSSNILLDSNFNAKLSDFGLAVTDGSQNKNNVKLSGTLGYVAPEYLLDGKLTDKSDVYAFGVVLLELLLGKKPVEKLAPTQCRSIVTWAMPQLTDRDKLPNIVDPVIKDSMDLKHLYQVAAVAVLCVQPEPSYRPLITDVLHSLVPLVSMEHGGMLRNPQAARPTGPTNSTSDSDMDH